MIKRLDVHHKRIESLKESGDRGQTAVINMWSNQYNQHLTLNNFTRSGAEREGVESRSQQSTAEVFVTLLSPHFLSALSNVN